MNLSTKFQNRSRKAKQRGMNVMSVLLALVIGALVAATVYNQYNDSTRKARVDAAQAEIVGMIASTQKLYGNANQYGAVTTAIAVQSGVVPARLRVSGTNTAQNVYNGSITFVPATITTPNDSMVMTYGGVKREDCQDLVLGTDSVTRRMSVGATVVKAADSSVDVGALATACDANQFSDISVSFGRGA